MTKHFVVLVFAITALVNAQHPVPVAVCDKKITTFLFPDYLQQKPTGICTKYLPKTGYFDSFMVIFKQTKASSQTKPFQLLQKEGQWLIKVQYIAQHEDYSTFFRITYLDGNYALISAAPDAFIVVDIKANIIMAFAPARTVTGKLFPKFDYLYFLDKNLYPYASIDVGAQRGTAGSIKNNLLLTKYVYTPKAVESHLLDYRFTKDVYELNYKDILQYEKAAKNKTTKTLKQRVLLRANDAQFYKNLPYWL
jgi:hypothetical protein